MGFLSTDEVIECSATHLIGMFEGHTGPRVVELFERSLGKVLFIDEAYRLGLSGEHSFACDAVGEIVDCMMKPRYHGKLVIVLAGYTHDVDLLLRTNAGLRGRFATEISCSPMSPESELRHLCGLLAKKDIELLGAKAGLDGDSRGALMELLAKLAETKGWASGRDVQDACWSGDGARVWKSGWIWQRVGCYN
jgi:AAA+ superfamily predicted ATPase